MKFFTLLFTVCVAKIHAQEEADLSYLMRSRHRASGIPTTFDWRTKGLNIDVQNEGKCNSTYAFAVVGAVEGHNFISKGVLHPLSTQQIVDCSTKQGNNGCIEGKIEATYKYITEAGGLNSAETYPYTGVKENCRFNSRSTKVKVRKYKMISDGNEEKLKTAVSRIGPVAVSIHGTSAFQDFNGKGVFYDSECKSELADLNQPLLVIGYGIDPNDQYPDYWIVKNSVGKHWGDNGYAKIARNRGNHCGIATFATYPELDL